jgi:hypothetical protein
VRVVVSGHVYQVRNVDGEGDQRIAFVQRRNIHGEPMAEAREGILSQELLRVLIDRTLYLYAEDPCEEDTAIIQHLRAALVKYETRAARRAIEKIVKPEEHPTCPICQHILCRGNHDY